MSIETPVFLLSVANALIERVSESTDQILETAIQMRNQEGFWDGIKGAVQAGSLIGSLHSFIDKAMKLAEKAEQASPGITIEDGIGARYIQARGYFQKGLIEFGNKRLKEAIKYFETSLENAEDQTTYLNIGICYSQMTGFFSDRTGDAIQAFRKCVEIDPHSGTAINAGVELAHLGAI
jgi:tetratricopeptide (TPR) repeat protein